MSSASVMINKSFGLSSACSCFMEIDNQELVVKKQGIVTILGSDVVLERSQAASLRRTLSADMSSKKWLAQNGFSPMKKIASSEELSMAVIPADSSFSSLSEGEEEEEEEYHRRRRHIWSCSVRDENNDKEVEKPGQFDIWSSIISQKANDLEASKSPPYIHPLVKRSASTLSENSLKICTESLGSETGSEGFSSYPASETSSDVEVASEEKEEDQQSDHQKQTQTQIISDIGEDYHPAVKFNNHHIHGGSAGGGGGSTRKSVLSFPPPIPSLSPSDGASLRMQTRRGNGRLVLEAVSIPNSQRNFRAERQDGRLVLTFLNSTITTTSPVVADDDYQEKKIIDNNDEEFDEKFINFDEEEKGKIDDDDDDDEEEIDDDDDDDDDEIEIEVEKEHGMREIEIEMEEAPKLSSRVINFHRLALVMDNNNKPIGLANMKQAWPRKFNEAAATTAIKKLEEDDDHHQKQMVPTAQSLPPRPPPAAAAAVNAATGAAASFNAYEYYWRGSNSTATTTHHLALKPLERNTNTLVISNNELMANHEDGRHHEHHQKLVVLRGNKADYLVPFLKGCKKPISCTSLLFWESHCIATS